MRLLRGIAVVLMALLPAAARAQHLLVPMDDDQSNHLKAYGLTYNALKDGARGEWLLNYRGGSFLLPDTPEIRRRAGLDGVSVQPVDDAALATIRSDMAGGNMDAITGPLKALDYIASQVDPSRDGFSLDRDDEAVQAAWPRSLFT